MNAGLRNQADGRIYDGMRNAYGDARPWEITQVAAAPKSEPWYRRVAKRIFGGSRPQASA